MTFLIHPNSFFHRPKATAFGKWLAAQASQSHRAVQIGPDSTSWQNRPSGGHAEKSGIWWDEPTETTFKGVAIVEEQWPKFIIPKSIWVNFSCWFLTSKSEHDVKLLYQLWYLSSCNFLWWQDPIREARPMTCHLRNVLWSCLQGKGCLSSRCEPKKLPWKWVILVGKQLISIMTVGFEMHVITSHSTDQPSQEAYVQVVLRPEICISWKWKKEEEYLEVSHS